MKTTNASRISEIRPTATNNTARLAEVLGALLAGDIEVAEQRLSAYRQDAGKPPSLAKLDDPLLTAAEADVEAAKELLAKAITTRSDVLRGIQARQGAGPYLTPAGKAQITSRTSSRGVTYFLRVMREHGQS